MRNIYRIAKTELRMLFCSPIAWVLLLIFVMQASGIFSSLCWRFANNNEWGNGISEGASFSFIMSMWMSTCGSLHFYIPLLTMGIISKDLSTGSIKLLYSSPISNAQIVLGKFFSTVMFAVVICVLLLLYVFVAGSMIEAFEWKAVFCGLLGVFLLACTYISIGIFVSSLTSYQFVAALGTYLLLALLSAVGGWWQEYDVVRDITYWLSINGRAFTFVTGMICSEDLIYFPVVTVMFLLLTIIRLNSKRQTMSALKVFSQYAGVVVGISLIAYFSSRPMLMAYYDATSTKLNSLTKQSQEIVKKLDGELKITGYSNIFNTRYRDFSFPYFVQRNREIFKQYERFKPDMKLKMVYYYDSITVEDRVGAARSFDKTCQEIPDMTLKERAKVMAQRYRSPFRVFKSPEELKAQGVDLRGERTANWLVEWKDKKVWLRTYPEQIENVLPKEGEISAALKGLVSKLHKVAIATGHGMRQFSDVGTDSYYEMAFNKDKRNPLINQGFDPVEIDLTERVADDVDILIVADMREPLTETEYASLKEYVDRGGNLMILGEQKRRDIINPMLEDLLGVRLMEGTLVQYRLPSLRPDVLISRATPAAALCSYLLDGLTLAMPSASGLEQTADRGFTYTPLFCTDTLVPELKSNQREGRSYSVWNEMESLDIDAGRLQCNSAAGEVAREYCTVAALSRRVGDKEQRILVSGDADCLGNEEMRQVRGGNPFFGLAAAHYLTNNEMPFDVRRPGTQDFKVHLNLSGAGRISTIFTKILPLLILGLAVVVWLRRRSR
ncbi:MULTISPECIES: Gldg family protein [Butyricimonas]|uniref:Gldg family protein n=1 Tax=Butyricimonas TaxID=574697 RepID=UPI0007FB41F2|nr:MULTISPECIES: Gldg family protein [Butyricimonas]